MVNRFIKMLSMFLAIVLLVNMLPLGIMAQELQSSATSNLSAAEADSVDDAGTADAEPGEIIAEIPEKRTEYSKEFLLSTGLRMAVMYAEPVHYQTDKGWEDIDNTLQTGTDGTYTNTAGIWDVSFPQELSKDESITIQKDGYTLSFYMAGALNSDNSAMLMTADDTAMMPMSITDVEQATAVVQAPDLTAMKETADFEETVLEKVQSQIAYEDVFENTDVIYNLASNKVKESLVLQSYSDTLRGYQYTLEVGEMIPVLAEDGTITFYDHAGVNVVMVMPAPFLIDNNGNYCNDIQVVLEGENGTYTMSYLLPVQWLGAQDRAWPVVLDPAVQPEMVVKNIRDKTVMTKKQSSHSNTWTRNGVGRSSDNGIMRTYLKYNDLPTLTSADVVIKAEVTMRTPSTDSTAVSVEVHKVIGTWASEDLVWADQDGIADDNDTEYEITYDPNIEDYALVNYSGKYTWIVTDIVRGWYSGENTGMMFKLSDAIENGTQNNSKLFYSSDYSESDNYQPKLTIYFRNNNGLEGYWDYTSATAGRAGTGYVNNFTGNLVWVRSDIGFSNCIMPVAISHVYNLNDADNNDFGLGNGWRTNYHERTYVWTIDDDYYVWEDEDGTDHYFEKSKDKDDGNNVYKDEDDLGLTLTVTNTNTKECTIKAKTGNTRYFDSFGRLVKIENNQPSPKTIEITYDGSSQKIIKIKDGANREYCFNYNKAGMLTEIGYCDLEKNSKSENAEHHDITYVTYEYDANGNLIKVTDKDDKVSTYSYTGKVLVTAKDIDGYQLTYSYYEPTQQWHPYRVRSISEKDGTKNGGCINITYDHNQTVFTDHRGQKEIHQFDDFGHTVCIQDDQGRAQFTKFTFSTDAEKDSNKNTALRSNQLTLSSELQYSVANLMLDNSMESTNQWSNFGIDFKRTQSTACRSTDYYSIKLKADDPGNGEEGWFGVTYEQPFVIQPGQTQTFSCDIRSTVPVHLEVSDDITAKYSDPLNHINTGWHRQQVSYTNKTDQPVSVNYSVVAEEYGEVYIDCPQLELANNAGRYNLLNDGDFATDSKWKETNFSGSDGYVTLDKPVIPQFNSTVLKINGSTSEQKSVSQNVYMDGKAGDSLIFAGWAKGNSAPLGTFGDKTRKFAIECQLFYTDSQKSKVYSAVFNPDSNDWQYTAGGIVAEKNFYRVELSVVYDYNVNTAMFDGIQLFKEAFGTTFDYTENNNNERIVTVTDCNNQKTVYTYDKNDNLVKEKLPSGVTTTNSYDEDYHNLTKSETSEGVTTTYTYDKWGNNTKVTVSDGSKTMTTSSTYTSNGNRLLSTTDNEGLVTNYQYDEQTGLLKWTQQTANGETLRTSYSYDQLFRQTDQALGKVTTQNSTETVSPITSAGYAYENDLLTGITTPTTTYGFTYGAFSQRTKATVGDRTLATYTYNNHQDRQLLRLDYGNGDKVQYTYDSQGRVTKETYEDGDTVTYTYDNAGAVASVKDSSTGIKSEVMYSAEDQLARYTEIGGDHDLLVRYKYDEQERISSILYMVDNVMGKAHNSTYSYTDNRLTSYRKGNGKLSYTYDKFERTTQTKLTHSDADILTTKHTFRTPATGQTSNQVSKLQKTANGYGITYNYSYDDRGNITAVWHNSDTSKKITYSYDSLNQLVRENNPFENYTHTWTYDNSGNIKCRKEYAYTTGTLGTPTKTVKYAYKDAGGWGDLLTEYDGQAITYDAIGNPDAIDGWEFTWEHGRELASMEKGATTWDFTYNADGLRTKRTNGSTTYDYVYYGGQLMYMMAKNTNSSSGTTGNHHFLLSYTPEGIPMGITYQGTAYYYLTNLQGDVVAILNNQGQRIISYSYDAWGNPLDTVIHVPTDNENYEKYSTIAERNPLRYRGYVYDAETGFYYVSSRYYDPEIGRWINADNQIAGVGGEVLGYNMFAYCMNNPVNMSDPTGNWPSWSNLLKGSAWLAVGITAVCVGVSVLTCGVAAPAMVAVAAVTVGAGALTAVNGAAEIGEAFTGYNVVRDTVFSGNQKAYDAYANTTAAVAEVGTAVCGGWLKSPSTQTKIADKTLQNVIDNPNSVTKLSTDKFHKIANKSSWEFKPTQNNKGYRALKGDMSIRYNMNGTRFDAAHFGGSPYWVISSAKNGTIKIMMP